MLERKIYERHFEVELIGLRDLINEGVKDEKKKTRAAYLIRFLNILVERWQK